MNLQNVFAVVCCAVAHGGKMSCAWGGLHGHPHTVRASTVPLYLQGVQLGQNGGDPSIDLSTFDPSSIDFSMPAPTMPDFSLAPATAPPEILPP